MAILNRIILYHTYKPIITITINIMQETINQCFTIPQEQNDFDQNREYMRRHDRSRKNQIPKIGNKVIPIHTTYGYSFPHSVEQNQEKTESRLWNTL